MTQPPGLNALLVSGDPEAVVTVERHLREAKDTPIDIVETRSLRGVKTEGMDLVVVDLRDFENREDGLAFLRRTLSGEQSSSIVVALVGRDGIQKAEQPLFTALHDMPEAEVIVWPAQSEEVKRTLQHALAAAGLAQILRSAIHSLDGFSERMGKRLVATEDLCPITGEPFPTACPVKKEPDAAGGPG